MGKAYSAEILVAADEPRSTQELSDELDIPIATCYRRVEELTEQGLLEPNPSTAGRQETTYQRSVDEVCVGFKDTLSVSITHPPKVKTTLDRLWSRVH